MNSDHEPKIPVPPAVRDFRLWTNELAPGFAVFEIDIAGGSLQFLLSVEQLQLLERGARTTIAKLAS